MLYPYASTPLLRIALCMIPGIIMGRFFYAYAQVAGLAGWILIALWCLLFVFQRYKKRYYPETGILIMTMVFLFAWQYSGIHYKRSKDIRTAGDRNKHTLVGRISQLPVQQASGKWAVPVQLKYVKYEQQTIEVYGDMRLSIRHMPNTFAVGDFISFTCRPYAIPDTATGYAAFLLSTGVYFTASTDSLHFMYAGESLIDKAGRLAAACRAYLYRVMPESESAGLCTALITGDRSGLDKSTAAHHRLLGTTHILSVSGLHVGLICMVLIKILSLLDRMWNKGKQFRILLVILALWIYAMVTGLAPSVCRAVLMSSIVMAGQLIRRKAPIENILAATVIVELLWNPAWLFYAGFQLSFAAIAGLIWLQPLIRNAWEPPKVWMFRVWDMASATLAAQICTFPFLVPIADGFPLYFLPANLIIVPLASLITSGAFILVIMSPIEGVAIYGAKLLHLLCQFLDAIAAFLSRLPCATLPLPSSDFSFAITSAILVIVITGFWQYKSQKAEI
jgi:ComEC/Rec2-related protein